MKDLHPTGIQYSPNALYPDTLALGEHSTPIVIPFRQRLDLTRGTAAKNRGKSEK